MIPGPAAHRLQVAKVAERVSLSSEASTGNRGDAVSVGADYATREGSELYGTYTLSTDRTDAGTSRR